MLMVAAILVHSSHHVRLHVCPCCVQDIEAVDPEYYKNLKWMLENDITDVLDLTFTAESDFFGKTEVRQEEYAARLRTPQHGRV
jgi:hypothetical protein